MSLQNNSRILIRDELSTRIEEARATGARIVLTLLHEMKRRNLDFGIAALCVGGGQGAPMLLERR